MDQKKEKLAGKISPGNILDNPETLETYSRDQSFALPVKPWLVVKPRSLDEVKGVIEGWPDAYTAGAGKLRPAALLW